LLVEAEVLVKVLVVEAVAQAVCELLGIMKHLVVREILNQPYL